MTKKRNTRYKLKKADWFIFVFCSIGAAAALGLYYKDINSFSLKNNERTVAVISFKRNVVQRKFIDNDIWEKLNNQSPVYNGDKIRTAGDSAVFANFENSDAKIQLNENSLIQIFDDKKEKAIEFIGGEILLSSGSGQSDVTARVGKKKISASSNSKVKIAISKTEQKAPQEAVVEVLEGQVQIDSIEKPKKKRAQDEAQEATEILKAGEQAVLDVAAVQEKDEKKDDEKAIAKAEAPIETPSVQSEAPKPVESAELSKSAQPEKISASAAKEESAQKDAAQEIPQEEESAGSDEPEEIEEDFEATERSESIKFAKNVYDKKTGASNFMYSIPLRKLFGANKTIPAGAAIDLTFTGVANKNVPEFRCIFSNGTNVWKDASPAVPIAPTGGRGFRAGGKFADKVRIVLTNAIETTSKGHLAFSYDSKYGDEELTLSGFSVAARIVALDAGELTSPLGANHKTSFHLDKTSLPRVPWEKKASGFELFIPPERIWGQSKKISKGTKIKLGVTGTASAPLEFMSLNLFNGKINNWDSIQTQKICDSGVSEINYSGTITLEKDIPISDMSVFEFTMDAAKSEKTLTLTNLRLTVEVVQ